jgi:hemolysin-activating ACP:hemolysin acyltransferase
MTDADPEPTDFGEESLKSLDKTRVGAAASKLFSASVGEVTTVLSRSARHKHYSLADIEWMVLPPVALGQFYVAEAMHKELGFRVPIAVVTWALVSEDVDLRLRGTANQPVRLRPDEWQSGDIGWLIDAAGDGRGLDSALQWLSTGPFRQSALNLIKQDGRQNARTVSTLEALMACRIASPAT